MRLVSPIEAAYILGTSRQSVWRWISEKRIPSIQMSEGGKRLVDLAQFLKDHGIDPVPYFDTLDKMKIKDDNEE